MMKPDRSSYSGTDFAAWQANGQLSISPRFQRRGVWSTAARSFLIDTILQGYPVPPIYIRIVKEKGKIAPVREIIDGQQRITAIVDYINGKYQLAKNLDSKYSGRVFSELDQEYQDQITSYNLICEVFQGISDEDVLAIFARLNTYSVSLNKQELRNGKFFGQFKQTCYDIAYSHLTFWRNNKIFTETSIARMLEVEFTSELIIALFAGPQDKKKSIDSFYQRFDDGFPERKSVEKKFRTVIDEINEAFPEGLQKTEFRRTPLFYSMFLAIAQRLFGLPGVNLPQADVSRLSDVERRNLKKTIDELSQIILAGRAGNPVGGHNTAFVTASLSQTDNIRPRMQRLQTIYNRAF